MTIAVLCTGCGGPSSSHNSMEAGTETDDRRDTANVAPRGHTPSPSVAVLTIHVKDMGTRLNLL